MAAADAQNRRPSLAAERASPADRYRHLWRQTLLRLLLTYLAPLLLLTAYFHLRYRGLAEEARSTHLLAIAESQAGTLDLFLRERLANLFNVIDDTKLPERPSARVAEELLQRLQRDSSSFVDVGFFGDQGFMLSYAGPYPALKALSYGREPWFTALLRSQHRFVITDMYQGFRRRPHFTIAVRRRAAGRPVALRATLDPARVHDYVRSLRGAPEVHSVLVSASGEYQEVSLPPELAASADAILPPRTPRQGVQRHAGTTYAYCWLEQTGWALIVLSTGARGQGAPPSGNASLIAFSVAIVLAVFSAIVIRARSIMRRQKEEDSVRRELSGQLQHASRLASIGELAAGVAHEINNPLAVIAEEAGLMQDLMNPELVNEPAPPRLGPHLSAIQEAVFRARDVTRKLLSFVRRTEVSLARHDVHEMIEDIVGGLLEREMRVANIEVVRRYAGELPKVLADRGQIEQVIINLVTNAIDAMPRGGRLTLTTTTDGEAVRLRVSDSGVGITPESLERVFMPFHTTKEVGKGTGLGLSVSYGIVKNHGGDILVESQPGVGSTFTVVLPVEAPNGP
jgi:two-component system NtrC family sensor kinase